MAAIITLNWNSAIIALLLALGRFAYLVLHRIQAFFCHFKDAFRIGLDCGLLSQFPITFHCTNALTQNVCDDNKIYISCFHSKATRLA